MAGHLYTVLSIITLPPITACVDKYKFKNMAQDKEEMQQTNTLTDKEILCLVTRCLQEHIPTRTAIRSAVGKAWYLLTIVYDDITIASGSHVKDCFGWE